MQYPNVLDASLVGTYPASAKAGGGYVWDEVLEYRVWCHPERGAPNEADGSDYYYAFATYEDAVAYFQQIKGAEEPIALVLQREYISEEEPGEYVHVKEERVTEWPVAFLNRPRRTARTIPDFLAPDAPAIGSTSCAGLRRNMHPRRHTEQLQTRRALLHPTPIEALTIKKPPGPTSGSVSQHITTSLTYSVRDV